MSLFIDTRFLWLPIVLFLIFWDLWVYYIRARYIKNLRWVLLEIKLPREIVKSPKSMEMVLNSLCSARTGDLIERYWDGYVTPWYSLEIVGMNGEIRFFVYTQAFFRNLVESQIYAQYPDVEIVEVDDYSKMAFINGFGTEWNCVGTEYALTAEDAKPIKTYVDYGLHEVLTKEEQKNDPITAFIEILGSLKEGEQIWMQILIKGTRKKWQEEGKKLIEKIIKEKEAEKSSDKEVVSMGALKLLPGEREVIEAIERDVSKLGFDVGMRQIYLARKDKFNYINVISMIGVMKQYNALNLNGFKVTNYTSLDYPWQFKNIRVPIMKKKMLENYRQRSYFYINYERLFAKKKTFILNTEELATIFHFPGRVAETPTFARIEAKKGEAPSNLPV